MVSWEKELEPEADKLGLGIFGDCFSLQTLWETSLLGSNKAKIFDENYLTSCEVLLEPGLLLLFPLGDKTQPTHYLFSPDKEMVSKNPRE